VSAFNYFDELVTEQQSQAENAEQQHQQQYSLASQED